MRSIAELKDKTMRHLTKKAAVALAVTIGGVLGSDRPRRICLRSERDLVQLRHRGQSCRRIVIEDSSAVATVQYSCSGAGYGRTRIRRESAELVQLQSDGIERGSPFSLEAEGRRVGACK